MSFQCPSCLVFKLSATILPIKLSLDGAAANLLAIADEVVQIVKVLDGHRAGRRTVDRSAPALLRARPRRRDQASGMMIRLE